MRTFAFTYRDGCEIITARVAIDASQKAPTLGIARWSRRPMHSDELPETLKACSVVDYQPLPRTCGCKSKVKLWLGCRWQGRPWPLRWRWRWPHLLYVDEPGCGCIIKLKAFWQVARNLRRGLREASRA